MPVIALCLAISLVLAFCTDTLAQPPTIELTSRSESWSGLAGKLVIDGKEFMFTDKECTEPSDNKDRSTKQQIKGGLWVRGLSKDAEVQVELESGVNLPEVYAGMYLSYSDSLSLIKERSPSTIWRCVNYNEKNTPKQHYRGTRYNQTKTQSFELEAINRPGFFLSVDAKGFLTLKDKRGHTIEFKKETLWKDVRSGN